jgi:hypothetical protein
MAEQRMVGRNEKISTKKLEIYKAVKASPVLSEIIRVLDFDREQLQVKNWSLQF